LFTVSGSLIVKRRKTEKNKRAFSDGTAFRSDDFSGIILFSAIDQLLFDCDLTRQKECSQATPDPVVDLFFNWKGKREKKNR